MFHPEPISTGQSDTTDIYIQWLIDKIHSLELKKDNDIRSNNQAGVEATKKKIHLLKSQLSRAQNQLSADILSNALWKWENDLIQALSSFFDASSSVQPSSGSQGSFSTINNKPVAKKFAVQNMNVRRANAFIENFLTSSFHVSFSTLLQSLPDSLLDSVLKSLLLLWPYELADVPKSPLGFDAIFKRFPKNIISQIDAKGLEFIRCLVSLALLDLFSLVTDKYKETNVSRDSIEHLRKLTFSYLKQPFAKKLPSEYSSKLHDFFMFRWSVLIGNLSRFDYSIRIAIAYEILDPKKCNSEETFLMLNGLRYIEENIYNEAVIPDIRNLLGDLSSLVNKSKKLSIMVSAINLLEHIVSQLDFTKPASLSAAYHQLVGDLLDLFNKAWKWAKEEELRPYASSLITVMLVNSAPSFFHQYLGIFLKEVIFTQRDKKKPYIYKCLLQLLQGNYYADNRKNALLKLKGFHKSIKEGLSCQTRPVGEEKPEVQYDRLKEICDFAFERKRSSIGLECVNMASLLLLQICANNIEFGKSVLLRLIAEGEDFVPELALVAVKTLKAILDPQKDFAYNAAIIQNSGILSDGLKILVPSVKDPITELLQFCDAQAGTFRIGKTSFVYEVYNFENQLASEVDERVGYVLSALTELDISETKKAYTFTSFSDEDIAMPKLLLNEIELKPVSRSLPELFEAKDNDSHKNQKSSDYNDIVESVIFQWRDKLQLKKEALSRTSLPNPPLPPKGFKRVKAKTLDNMVLVYLFKEIISLVQFLPLPSILTGKAIYYNLLHKLEDVNFQVFNSLQIVFDKNREIRATILYGLVDMLQIRDFQDEVCSVSILNQLIYFTNFWLQDLSLLNTVSKDSMLQLADKLEGVLFNELMRSEPKIRILSLKVMQNYNNILKYHSQIKNILVNEKQFIWEIIEKNELSISRRARRGYIMKFTLDDSIITPDLPLLKIVEVAQSTHAELWRYYVGEIASLVEKSCRPGCFKYVMAQLKMRMELWVILLSDSVDIHSVSSLFIFLQIFAHQSQTVPVQVQNNDSAASEPQETTMQTSNYTNDSTTASMISLMFYNALRGLFKEILFSRSDLNRKFKKQLVFSFMYTNKNVIRLIMEDIKVWMSEENSNVLEKSRSNSGSEVASRKKIFIKTTLVKYLFQVTRNPIFQDLAFDKSVISYNKLNSFGAAIADFLIEIEQCLFQSSTPLNEFPCKMAFQYCSIVARCAASLSYCSVSGNESTTDQVIRGNWRKTILPSNDIPWSNKTIMRILMHLYDWSNVLVSVVKNNITIANTKKQYSPSTLYGVIGLAVEKIVDLSDLFQNQMPPEHVLFWFEQMEKTGFRIVRCLLKHSFNSIIDYCLAQSYNENEAVSQAFFKAINDHLRPRPWRERLRFESKNDKTEALTEYSAIFSSWSSSIQSHGNFDHELFVNVENGEGNLRSDRQSYPQQLVQQIKLWHGALLFWSMFNTLHRSDWTRNQAASSTEFLILLKELEKSDGNNDLKKYFDRRRSLLQTSVPRILLNEVKEHSKLASRLFQEYSPQFITEGIKCSRIVERYNQTQSTFLVKEQQLIYELLKPWLQFAAFEVNSSDNTSNELLSYLLDLKFYFDIDGSDFAWSEISMTSRGPQNVMIVLEYLVQISSECGKLLGLCIDITLKLCEVHPEMVINMLIQVLLQEYKDSDINKACRKAASLYVQALCSHLHDHSAQGIDSNLSDLERRTNSVIWILSEVCLKHYQLIGDRIIGVLTYCLVNLPDIFEENSSIRKLLFNLIQGCLEVNKNRNVSSSKKDTKVIKMLEAAAQVITVFQLPYSICWDEKEKSNNKPGSLNDVDLVLNIDIASIVDNVCSVFSFDNDSFISDLALKSLSWVENKKVPRKAATKALHLYRIVVMREEILVVLDGVQSKMIEAIGSIKRIETIPPSNIPGLDEDSPESLALFIKASLQLHNTLITSYSNSPVIKKVPILLLTSACVLLVGKEFPDIYEAALNNCLLFLKDGNHMFLHKITESAEYQVLFSKIKFKFLGVIDACLSFVFDANLSSALSTKSLEVILLSSEILGDSFVSPAQSGFFYLLIYSILWIYSRLFERTEFENNKEDIFRLVKRLTSCLRLKMGNRDFLALHDAFFSLLKKDQLEGYASVYASLERVMIAFSALYFPEYAHNLAELLTSMMTASQQYKCTIINILKIIWQHNSKKTKAFDLILKRLPFTQSSEVTEVLCQAIKDCASNSSDLPSIDVDLITSTIKPYEFPDFVSKKSGSVSPDDIIYQLNRLLSLYSNSDFDAQVAAKETKTLQDALTFMDKEFQELPEINVPVADLTENLNDLRQELTRKRNQLELYKLWANEIKTDENQMKIDK